MKRLILLSALAFSQVSVYANPDRSIAETSTALVAYDSDIASTDATSSESGTKTYGQRPSVSSMQFSSKMMRMIMVLLMMYTLQSYAVEASAATADEFCLTGGDESDTIDSTCGASTTVWTGKGSERCCLKGQLSLIKWGVTTKKPAKPCPACKCGQCKGDAHCEIAGQISDGVGGKTNVVDFGDCFAFPNGGVCTQIGALCKQKGCNWNPKPKKGGAKCTSKTSGDQYGLFSDGLAVRAFGITGPNNNNVGITFTDSSAQNVLATIKGGSCSSQPQVIGGAIAFSKMTLAQANALYGPTSTIAEEIAAGATAWIVKGANFKAALTCETYQNEVNYQFQWPSTLGTATGLVVDGNPGNDPKLQAMVFPRHGAGKYCTKQPFNPCPTPTPTVVFPVGTGPLVKFADLKDSLNAGQDGVIYELHDPVTGKYSETVALPAGTNLDLQSVPAEVVQALANNLYKRTAVLNAPDDLCGSSNDLDIDLEFEGNSGTQCVPFVD